MKTLFTILTFILSVQAQAQGLTDFYSISADSYKVSPLCPINAFCITDGTVIDLEYTVKCTETMVSFTYDAIEKGEDLHVYISTVVGTEASDGPACLAFSTVEKRISLINQYGKVVLHHLGTVRTSAPSSL